MHGLTSTVGIVALAATAVAVIGLAWSLMLSTQLRRLRADQRVLLGDGGRDLTAHAAALDRRVGELAAYVSDAADGLHHRMDVVEGRIDGAVSHVGLVRYDAYGEMSGRQSTSIALLDSTASGVVLSSIHHRDQARLYTKQVHDGRGELELSPEEAEAVSLALQGAGAPTSQA